MFTAQLQFIAQELNIPYLTFEMVLHAKDALLRRDGDKRHITSVSYATNPQGRTFVYGRFGRGKKAIIVTIGYIGETGDFMLDNS